MSMGPLSGIAGSAAGSPLSQTKGSDVERAQQDTSNQQRRVHTDTKAENAAGIGETDGEDHETGERDADGRRIWEPPPERPDAVPEEEQPDDQPTQPKDPTGQAGNLLDLTG